MSFNYENQKRRDLWSAIYVLKDGIVKMRERNKTEIELRITMDEELKLLHEKQELENIRRESLKKYVLLKDRLKTVSESLSKKQQKKESLKKQIEELNDEINEYIKYTDMFDRVTYEDFMYLINNRRTGVEDLFEAIVLMSINNGIKCNEREKIVKKLKEMYNGFNMFDQEDIQKAYINYIGSRVI